MSKQDNIWVECKVQYECSDLLDALGHIPEVKITDCIPEVYTESIIEFEFESEHFHAHNAYVRWSFFARSHCPRDVIDRLEDALAKSS